MSSPTSTTVLCGFSSAADAFAGVRDGALAAVLDETQLVELCGAFNAEHVAELRRLRPQIPVGLVTYTSDVTDQLHRLFSAED